MSKKYQDKDYVKEELNLTDKQLIKAEGIKWLNEKYYRKSYLEYLERTKLALDGTKI